MPKQENNYAFIDGQNLYLSIKQQNWNLDFLRFRKYLKDKYQIQKAFIFLGFLKEQGALYRRLRKNGYYLIFKPTINNKNGLVKGNCDAELVLHTMIEYPEYNKAIIVTGDGDFYCLIKYLIKKDKLKKVLVPNKNRYSALFKKISRKKEGYKFFEFISDLKKKAEYKKHLNKDRTSQGVF